MNASKPQFKKHNRSQKKMSHQIDCTACGSYAFDDIIKGKTLFEHATNMNDFLERENGWKKNTVLKEWPPKVKLGRDTWGANANAFRIAYAFHNSTSDSSVEDIAASVHEGWKMCYVYWIGNKPWIDGVYHKPSKRMVSHDKLERLVSKFEDLPEDTKKICMQMAGFIKRECY